MAPNTPTVADTLRSAGLDSIASRWSSWPPLDGAQPSDPNTFTFSTPECVLLTDVVRFTNVVGHGTWQTVPAEQVGLPAANTGGDTAPASSFGILDATVAGDMVLGDGSHHTDLGVVGRLSANPTCLTLNIKAGFEDGFGLGSLLDTMLAPLGLASPGPEELLNKAVSSPSAELTVETRAFPAWGVPIASRTQGGPATALMDWSVSYRLELSFVISSGQSAWEPVPGLLAFRAPQCLLVVEGGTVDPIATLHLRERFTLFGATWTLDLQVPSLSGSLTLQLGEPSTSAAAPTSAATPTLGAPSTSEPAATLGGLLSHFGLHDVGGLGKIGITQASASIDGENGQVQFGLAFSGATLDLGAFHTSLVSLAVGYATGLGGGVTAELHVQVTLGSVTVDLWATHPGPGLGWQFSGGPSLDALPSLTEVLRELRTSTPDAFKSAALTALSLAHDTLAGTWHIEVSATLGSATLSLIADKSSTGAGSDWLVSGTLHVGDADLAFQLVEATFDGTIQTLALASLEASGAGVKPAEVLADLLQQDVPEGLPEVSARRLLVLFDKITHTEETTTCLLIAADLDLAIDFSGLRKLPFLGEHLPANATVSATLSLAYAKGFAAAPVFPPAEIAGYLPATMPALPAKSPEGVAMQAQLMIGGHRFTLPDAPPDLGPAPMAPVGPPAPPSTSPPLGGLAGKVAWHDVGVTLGGFIQVRRVGTAMESGTLTMLIDGSVGLPSLTLELLGLGLNYDIKTRASSFAFLGMGFSFERGPLGVSAAFMNMDGDFVGTAAVRTSTFALTALGGFAEVGGAASIFLYGVLDAPIGGPPFFFVDGLAGGFGINRRLTPPAIANVAQFPFVEAAMGPATPPSLDANPTDTLEQQLAGLHAYLAPSRGDMFFAAGVKFNSFHLIDGFLLAIVALDQRHRSFSVDVLGQATVQVPPAPDPLPLVFVELDLLATFRPAEGELMVQAALNAASYVITPDCHLTGGMAAGFWFSGEHAGDFVVSVGGYHPDFKVPAHYPVPARLGVDWQISDCVHASGTMYYALTPQALMLGFGFSLTWHGGPLSAWFDAGLDFLMEFHPPHFDGRGYIEIGASFHTFLGNITVSAGAELHIWGPPFAGEAWAHLGPFHAHVSFGSAPGPSPLTWPEFKTKLLPAPDKWLSTTVAGGFVRHIDVPGQGGTPTRWTQVRAKELSIVVESALPVSDLARSNALPAATALPAALALRPCAAEGAPERTWGAGLDIVITSNGDDVTNRFQCTPTSKRFPSSLWASRQHTDRLIEASAGFAITPATPVVEGHSLLIRRSDLAYTDNPLTQSATSGARLFAPCFERTDAQRAADREALATALPNPAPARQAVLSALAVALDAPTLRPHLSDRVGPATPDAWLYAPHLASVSTP